jgi:tellurite methyltransferase
MKNRISEHYDKLYSSEKVVFGNGRPSPLVKVASDHISTGKVLDIGGGEGRNALYFATKGFDVEVIDLSKAGLDKIEAKAKELNLSIKVRVADITETGIDSTYDLIISSFMFHHLSKDEALTLVQQMKEHVAPRGYIIISAFTKKSEFFENDPTTDRYYPALNEIKTLYNDWNIVQYDEEEGKAFQKREDGTNMINVSASLLAQKKD